MRRNLCLALFFLFALASSAFGQIIQEGPDGQRVREDNIDSLETSRPIVEYALAGGFLIGVLAIGFKNSKRAHMG